MRILFVLIIITTGCFMYSNGHYNEYQQYVPKNPQFSLKDKEGLVLPSLLDLEGIYQLSSSSYRGEITYPVDATKPNAQFDPRYNVSYYILFFKNGRALKFSTPTLNKDGSEHVLNRSDVSEKRAYISKEYWYADTNNNRLQMETFVAANGQGKYIISDAILEPNKLIFLEKNDQFQDASVYTLVPFDKSLLNDFKIDW